jgi:hypothetical protein|tara:strand:+ start:532 stop:897 length:366 start_codon:yes stop_codon:yes gene_type:complete
MDEIVEKALLKSIQKWVNIIYNDGEDEGVTNCPLCKMFHSSGDIYYCDNCPMRNKYGKFCGEVYRDWQRHQDFRHNFSGKVECHICKKYAKRFLNQLIRLYPKQRNFTKWKEHEWKKARKP